ncbi:MAG: polyprenyl diphosphate synthase [Oscillochloridaceae bacterium umkhey_bin13]
MSFLPQGYPTLQPYEGEVLVPRHLGLIMDGNGRWATRQGQSRLYGHRVGLEHIHTMVPICFELGIEIVSGYLWSLENWRRPAGEVSHMLGLLRTFGRSFMLDLHTQGVRIVHSGNRDGLHESDLAVIDEAVAMTRNNGPHIFNIVFNYSGRDELVRAARMLASKGLPPEALSEEILAAHLFAPLPPLDMVIRTAGEFRLSNFLLWQSAGAVAYVIDVLWPDVTRADLEAALRVYACAQRSRSLGGQAD